MGFKAVLDCPQEDAEIEGLYGARQAPPHRLQRVGRLAQQAVTMRIGIDAEHRTVQHGVEAVLREIPPYPRPQ